MNPSSLPPVSIPSPPSNPPAPAPPSSSPASPTTSTFSHAHSLSLTQSQPPSNPASRAPSYRERDRPARKSSKKNKLHIMNPTPPPDAPSRQASQSSLASAPTSPSRNAPKPGVEQPSGGMGPTPPYSRTPPPGNPEKHSPPTSHAQPPVLAQPQPQHPALPQPQPTLYQPLAPAPAPTSRPISLTGHGRVSARVMQRAVSASLQAEAHAQQQQQQQQPVPPQPKQSPPQPQDPRHSQLSGHRVRPSLPALPNTNPHGQQGQQGQQASPPVPSPVSQNQQTTRVRALSQSHSKSQSLPPQPLQPTHTGPHSEVTAAPVVHGALPPLPGQDAAHPQPNFVPLPPSALYAQHYSPQTRQSPQSAQPPQPALPEGADSGRAPGPPRNTRITFAPQLPSALYAPQPAAPARGQEPPPTSPPKPYPFAQSPGMREQPLPDETDVDLPGVTLHRDFCRDGDVVIVCSERDSKIGFMVQRAALSRVSPVFAASLRALEPARLPTLEVNDPAEDMALLLLALVHGAVGAPRSQRPPPTIAEYLALNRLYAKYAVRPFLLAMLRHRVAERGIELAAPLANPRSARSEITGFLRLAAAFRSSRLWDCALKYARTWQFFVSPWRMDEGDIAAVGEDAYAVLLALEALRNVAGESAWADLRVVYSSAGRAGVLQASSHAREDTVFWIDETEAV